MSLGISVSDFPLLLYDLVRACRETAPFLFWVILLIIGVI